VTAFSLVGETPERDFSFFFCISSTMCIDANDHLEALRPTHAARSMMFAPAAKACVI